MQIVERIYTPDSNKIWRKQSWQEMWEEARNSRELVWRLFMREFSARYRQTVLGVVWALVLPLFAVTTFVFLNRSGLLNVGSLSVPYPLYALVGLTLWQVFAGGLTTCSNAVVASGSIVIKINFPKETLVVAAFGQVLLELLVRLMLVAVFMAVFKIAPSWTIIFFPFTLLPLILLTLGVGFLLALINVAFRDVVNAVTPLLQLLMFLTPVVYPVPASGFLSSLMTYNPLSIMITAPRDLLLMGYFSEVAAFGGAFALTVLFFLASWRIFHLVEFKMAEIV